MSKVCENCAYWNPEPLQQPKEGMCLCGAFRYERDAEAAPHDGMSYGGDEGSGWFMTGPHFGCIHWTNR